MLIVLPDFVVELKERIDEVIKDIAIKNHINLQMIDDSKSVEKAKEMISSTLVDLYWNYNVQDRERLEEFEKDMKNIGGKKRKKGKGHLSKAHKRKIGRAIRKSWKKKSHRKKTKKGRYPKEMEDYIRSIMNKVGNKELVELINDRFVIETTAPRLSNYMTVRGIRRKR